MLKDKAALVTGAGSGIGRAIAVAAARNGAAVVVSDVSEAHGVQTRDQIRAAGGRSEFVRADVASADEVRGLVERCVALYGRLDVACNNAGIGGELAATADYPEEAWHRVIATNLDGVFYGVKYQIRQMRRQGGGGAIVNISSILGQVGFANAPAYAAAKHGVVGLTQTAALEYGVQGIRINAVGPAFIRTPMIDPVQRDEAARQALIAQHPIGRLGEPEEVANLVIWLASDQASFVTGSYYPIDGGYLAR
jgi:NAD(P)-dependent dehydrogenase (short-subunit alcohol dehydrogenase family)